MAYQHANILVIQMMLVISIYLFYVFFEKWRSLTICLDSLEIY